jgi:3-oxoacyl-[acyl-carrier protein] reductase
MSVSLNGRTALVTGSSRGIGQAIAEQLAADGAAIVINYTRNEQPARAVVNRIVTAGPSLNPIRPRLGMGWEAHKQRSDGSRT